MFGVWYQNAKVKKLWYLMYIQAKFYDKKKG